MRVFLCHCLFLVKILDFAAEIYCMKGIFIFIFSTIIALTFFGCRKNNSNDTANIFYGKWSKGTNPGDTIFFYQRNGQNLLAYNLEFNPNVSFSTEVDYSYSNGKLNVSFLGHPNDFSPIESFSWKQYGQEFEIHAVELFYILSSTQVYFTYHKLQ